MNKFLCKLPNGKPLFAVLRYKDTERLNRTHFRGRDVCFAGNVVRWSSTDALFSDPQVVDLFKTECLSILSHSEVDGKLLMSFTLDLSQVVGWSTTDALENYTFEELEPFKPNKRSSALRVKAATGRLAPSTKLLTFVCEFRHETEGNVRWTVLLRSLYPGEDVGEMRGNVSNREQVAFFDWVNPGMALDTSVPLSV